MNVYPLTAESVVAVLTAFKIRTVENDIPNNVIVESKSQQDDSVLEYSFTTRPEPKSQKKAVKSLW